MKILLLNWRDMQHPQKGGAEVLTHAILTRLAAKGHDVTWFAGSFKGARSEEHVDGVNIVRGGNAVTVRAHAYGYYREHPEFDVVVDEINTLPFFTPLYAKTPVVAFICQLAREVWFYEAPPIAARVGYAIEPAYLRPYRNVPTMTISKSSASSLRDEAGFRGRMGIMPMAIDQYEPSAPLPFSERDDVIVALGRVTPSKRLDQSIRALSILQEPPYDRLKLLVIGGGSPRVRAELDTLAHSLGVGNRVIWSGFVAEAEKRSLLAHAKALVMTSVREGWGLAVTEANLAGTPAVGYGILGLRDSIKNQKTGLVTQENPESLAEGLRALFDNRADYDRMAAAAQADARTLTWASTATFVDEFLRDIVNQT